MNSEHQHGKTEPASLKWSGHLTLAILSAANGERNEVRCRILTNKRVPCAAATNLGLPCSSRRNWPKPKPPPVAAGCGARGRHKVHTGQAPLGAAWLQQPAEKKLRAGVAWPSPAAGAGGVSPPVPSPGGTPGQPAGGTPAVHTPRRTLPRRRRWKQRRFS